MDVFRSAHIDVNTIAMTPVGGYVNNIRYSPDESDGLCMCLKQRAFQYSMLSPPLERWESADCRLMVIAKKQIPSTNIK